MNNASTNKFQSAPPRGGRPTIIVSSLRFFGFNPRPRVGGDVVARDTEVIAGGFNPRPRVGGDVAPSRSA